MVWFVKYILIIHTAENLDKWIQVATIDSQYYKSVCFLHIAKLISIMTTCINWSLANDKIKGGCS